MNTINIKQLRALFPKQSIQLGEDIFISELTSVTNSIWNLSYPFRFNGYLLIYFYRGDAQLIIDMKAYTFVPNSLSITLPNNIVRLVPQDKADGKFHFMTIAVSKEWIYHFNVDINKLFSYGLSVINSPMIALTSKELKLAQTYYRLIRDAYSSERTFMKESVSFLFSSILCEIAAAWDARKTDVSLSSNTHTSYGKIYNSFLYLITKYHISERNVTFYAEKLQITPQHLSRVVKQISGLTPTENIDNFVIMEAKNMLRYTSYSIKEIAAQLNFSNQTVFYRFFKRHTHMHPSDFRKENINIS